MKDFLDKKVLILEKNAIALKVEKVQQSDNSVILEGIFTVFGITNENGRIYEEKGFLPHYEMLLEKIKANSLLGELDHPEKFDIELKNVSHQIIEMTHDKENRTIRGKIRLLNTPNGKIAQALVESNVPLSISSRAAGVVKENNRVEIKKIFTYDIVADPGFKQAVLEKINESAGIATEPFVNPFENCEDITSQLSIDENQYSVYDISNSPALLESWNKDVQQKTTPTSMDNKNFVPRNEMNNYSSYVSQEFKKIEEKIAKLQESRSEGKTEEEIKKIAEEMALFKDLISSVSEKLELSIQYAENISNEAKISIESVEEKLTNTIAYSEKLAETVDKGILYSEDLAQRLDKGIQYTESIAEKADQHIQYSELLAEKLDKGLQYAELLAEKADQGIEYTEHVSQVLNENCNTLNESIAKVQEETQKLNEAIKLTTPAVPATPVNENNSNTNDTPPVTEDKTTDIISKIDEALEAINRKKIAAQNKSNQWGFVSILNESERNKFFSLDEANRQKVFEQLNEKGWTKAEEVVEIISETIKNNTPKEALWIEKMPAEYVSVWEKLDESQKNAIKSQANLHRLESDYQIKNFWDTRTFEKKINMQRLDENVKNDNGLGYSSNIVKDVFANWK